MKTHTFLSTAAVALVVTSGAFAQSRRAQSPRAPILKKTIIKDPRRKIVADRLRRYLAELTKQLTAGVEDFWRRIEVNAFETNRLSAARASPAAG